jgi:POT family proton-dependent oligopeptide transporter
VIPGSLLADVMAAYWGVIPAIWFFGAGALPVLIAAILLSSCPGQDRSESADS